MRVTKPDWLESILSNLNWDILGVSLYIGDAIEDGIDWLIEWLNVSLEWGEALYAWAIDLREELLEVIDIFWAKLHQEVINILDKIEIWGDILAEWWQARKDDVEDLIDTAVEGLAELIVNWDTFWTTIWPDWVTELNQLATDVWFFFRWQLPELFDLQRAEEWWTAKFFDISDWMDTWVKTLAPFWEGWQDIRDTVLEFFADPLEWLLAKFTDWFLGPEA